MVTQLYLCIPHTQSMSLMKKAQGPSTSCHFCHYDVPSKRPLAVRLPADCQRPRGRPIRNWRCIPSNYTSNNTILDSTKPVWQRGQDCYSLFTPPTRTRQDKTVLSCLDPVSNFQVFSSPQYIWDWTVANRKLRRDKTNCIVLPPIIVFTPPTRTRQDKTVLSCPCRRCEQAKVASLVESRDYGKRNLAFTQFFQISEIVILGIQNFG